MRDTRWLAPEEPETDLSPPHECVCACMCAHTDATHSGERGQKGKEKAIKLSLLIATKADKESGVALQVTCWGAWRGASPSAANAQCCMRKKTCAGGMAP